MAPHSKQISQASLSALKVLIGRQVHTIYAPTLAVAGTHVAAPSFSIGVSVQNGYQWAHSFLNLKCVWSETPRFMNDYWEIQAFEDQIPVGISLNAENAMVSPCSISFYGNGPSAVTKIHVYTLSVSDDEDESESILYDKLIQFERDNGTSFCVACQLDGPGIAEDVRLTEDPSVMQSFIEGCQLRLTLR